MGATVALSVVRRGRHRRETQREPNGRRLRIEPMSGVLFQRILKSRRRTYEDRLLTCELGRLRWEGHLTSTQVATGYRIAEIYGEYERWQGLNRSARSPSYERAFGGAEVHTGEQEELADAARGEFMQLQGFIDRIAPSKTMESIDTQTGEIIPRLVPHVLRASIESLCVEDRPVLPTTYEALRRVFDFLALPLGVVRSR